MFREQYKALFGLEEGKKLKILEIGCGSGALEAIDSIHRFLPGQVTEAECQVVKNIIEEKYNTRIEQYKKGEKQWDTNVSITMVVRGEKAK